MSERKISVVIADDEERICRLITALGEWEALGMEVIGTAANGPEALKLLSEKPTDILITDIRMPGLTGIELIEQARELSPAIRFVIISGYAEFTYAQQAIHFGVEDYLLKPINKNQLNETLQRIAGKLLGEEARKQELTQKEELVESRILEVRNSLIRDLLIDHTKRLTKEELTEKYDFRGQGEIYCFLLVKLDIARKVAGEMDGDSELAAGEAFLWEKVRTILSTQLKELAPQRILYLQNHLLYGLLNFREKDEEAVREALRNSVNQFGSLKGIFRSGRLFLALGSSVRYTEDLGRSLESAEKAVGERLLKGEGRLLTLREGRSTLYEKKPLDAYSKMTSAALENYDEEGLLQAARSLWEEGTGTEGICGYELLALIKQAGYMLVMRLDLPDGMGRLTEYYRECDNCSTASQLLEALERFSSSLLTSVMQSREDDTLRAIRQAKRYLANHFSEQITLEEVSEQSGLSAPYFSTLFKKETGTGFAKYLMGLRIDAAKEMLRESNLSVAQICQRVGYNDVKHFTKVFEQTAGIRPAVYRKLYG